MFISAVFSRCFRIPTYFNGVVLESNDFTCLVVHTQNNYETYWFGINFRFMWLCFYFLRKSILVDLKLRRNGVSDRISSGVNRYTVVKFAVL